MVIRGSWLRWGQPHERYLDGLEPLLETSEHLQGRGFEPCLRLLLRLLFLADEEGGNGGGDHRHERKPDTIRIEDSRRPTTDSGCGPTKPTVLISERAHHNPSP